MAEYRIDVVGALGNFIRSIRIDCPDDEAAMETAKQYIYGHDIEYRFMGEPVTQYADRLREEIHCVSSGSTHSDLAGFAED